MKILLMLLSISLYSESLVETYEREIKESINQEIPAVIEEKIVEKIQKPKTKFIKKYSISYKYTYSDKLYATFKSKKDMYAFISKHNLREDEEIEFYKIVITKDSKKTKITYVEESKILN